jgi:alpha-L-rhamnosidase
VSATPPSPTLQNLNFTRDNCNGIESYCLYYVLSVVDYWQATGDNASAAYFAAYVEPKLEHAHDIWGKNAPIGFYGEALRRCVTLLT